MTDNTNNPNNYEIKLQGAIRDDWKEWLNGQVVHIERNKENQNQTIINVATQDQAALRGILNKLWDLNLTIISLSQIKDKNGEQYEN